jgi:hypothetical protein
MDVVSPFLLVTIATPLMNELQKGCHSYFVTLSYINTHNVSTSHDFLHPYPENMFCMLDPTASHNNMDVVITITFCPDSAANDASVTVWETAVVSVFDILNSHSRLLM